MLSGLINNISTKKIMKPLPANVPRYYRGVAELAEIPKRRGKIESYLPPADADNDGNDDRLDRL